MPQPASSASPWAARVERARVLAERFPFAAQALEFFGHVTEFQSQVAEAVPPAAAWGPEAPPFRELMDPERWLGHVPDLLHLIQRVGTPTLADSARQHLELEPEAWRRLLTSYWATGGNSVEPALESSLFFARALLQPFAVALAASQRPVEHAPESAACPVCSGRPVAGVLRREGLGAKRLLMCSLCLTEWDYLRVLCPSCGEVEFQELPVYTAEGFEHLRVNACDSCRAYIITVDLTKDGHAIGDVDELAALPLSLWAEEKGYTKFQANLLGM